ncbi:c-type cytochrome [Polaromonas sp.]|uniref:c-type cytochrome n=2 Tax=Polaromonas sp. TaxID=1869339 RepID=UPI0027376ED8|nr:c-type cytochrome [Polaromonas sp.]
MEPSTSAPPTPAAPVPKVPMSVATLGLFVFAASMLGTLAVIALGLNLTGRDSPTRAATTAAPPSAASTRVASAPPGAAATAVIAAPTRFAPPDDRKIPDTEMGAVIRAGEQIFLRTGLNAKAFVGNSLNCVNCHLDAGRLAGSAPMWGAYPLYPAYRAKTKHVDSFAERLRGCFIYSMNGKAPPEGSDVLVALEAYSYWMATGAPVGAKLPGSGYKKLAKPPQVPDFSRGQAVYESRCALCHGADGQGQRSGEMQVFPPLWGPQSFNWGAGMHQVDNATAFIKANMPLGQGGTLSDQEAWDVATFMNGHERPQDPRFTGNVSDTRKKFHDSEFSLYGQTVNGKLLGTGR